jgi:3-oxoadipate enol-lactonase
MPTIRANGINMYYEIHGEGYPLLCVAGLSHDVTVWYNVKDQFAKHFQVILLDNRGAGRTETPDSPYTIHTMAEDVFSLLEALKIPKAHLLGHSMGGWIAQTLAYQHPEKIEQLILYATSAKAPVVAGTFFKAIVDLREKYPEISVETVLKLFIPWGYSEQFINNANLVAAFIQNATHYPYLQSSKQYAGQVDACVLYDISAEIHKITAKTLILGPKADIIMAKLSSEYLQQQIKNSHLEYCDGGHNSHIEYPQAFVDNVLGFLQ